MFSDTLLEHIREVKRTSFRFDGSRDAVIANLTFLHDVVVASENLLIEAVEEIDALLCQSPFLARLAQYYRSHLEEERGHIEWIKEDLRSVGITSPELPKNWAVAMAGSQYYLLKHWHPAALLGYMAALEGDPTPVEVIESLEREYGKELLRFSRLHAVKDLEHRKELFQVIDDAPESLHGLISYSANNTLDCMILAAQLWGMARERHYA